MNTDLDPGSSPWMYGILSAAVVAQWGLMVWFIHTGRKDARADRKRCEDANAKLSAEIITVRDMQTGKLADALESSAIALHAATTAQHQGNAVLDRVCRRLEHLPCARDAAERRGVEPVTPLNQKHG